MPLLRLFSLQHASDVLQCLPDRGYSFFAYQAPFSPVCGTTTVIWVTLASCSLIQWRYSPLAYFYRSTVRMLDPAKRLPFRCSPLERASCTTPRCTDCCSCALLRRSWRSKP